MTTQSTIPTERNHSLHIAKCLIEYMESTFQAWQQMDVEHQKNLYCSWRYQRRWPVMWLVDAEFIHAFVVLTQEATQDRIDMIATLTRSGFWTEDLSELTSIAIADCINLAKETLDDSELVEHEILNQMNDRVYYRHAFKGIAYTVHEEMEVEKKYFLRSLEEREAQAYLFAPDGFLFALMAVRMLVALGSKRSISQCYNDAKIFSRSWRISVDSLPTYPQSEFILATEMVTRTAFMELACVNRQPSLHLFAFANQLNAINARLYEQPAAVEWLTRASQIDCSTSFFRTTLWQNVQIGSVHSATIPQLADVFLKVGLLRHEIWANAVYDYFRESSVLMPLQLSSSLVGDITRALNIEEPHDEAFRHSAYNCGGLDRAQGGLPRLSFNVYVASGRSVINPSLEPTRGAILNEPNVFFNHKQRHQLVSSEETTVVNIKMHWLTAIVITSQDNTFSVHLKQSFESVEAGFRYDVDHCYIHNAPMVERIALPQHWTLMIEHTMAVVAYFLKVRVNELEPHKWRFRGSNGSPDYSDFIWQKNYSALK